MKKKRKKSITTIYMFRNSWIFKNSINSINSIPLYLKRIWLTEFKEVPGEPDEFHYDIIVSKPTKKKGTVASICFVRYGEIYLDR